MSGRERERERARLLLRPALGSLSHRGSPIILAATCISAWVMLDEKVAADLEVMSKYSGEACEGLDPAACAHAWGTLGVFRVMFGTSLFFGKASCDIIFGPLLAHVKAPSRRKHAVCCALLSARAYIAR